MKSVCLIGYGTWGKKIFKSLKQIKSIKHIQLIKNRKDKNKINLKNLDWVIIATNTQSHYRIVKKYLKKKINVFCEKPLTSNIKKNIELYDLANKNKSKLYVSDIENYKRIRIKLNNINYIFRSKLSENKDAIVERLAYHDFTYLYELIEDRKIKNLKILKKKKGQLVFSLNLDKKKFIFDYNLNKKKKIHSINNKSRLLSKNLLKIMLNKVINKKVDFKKNKKISLFSDSVVSMVPSARLELALRKRQGF